MRFNPRIKVADNYENDTRSWPDPKSPRAFKPPTPWKCTCPEGQKLNCPIHGMYAPDAESIGIDNANALPENSPVSYPQDAPRTWGDSYAFGSIHIAKPPVKLKHWKKGEFGKGIVDMHDGHTVLFWRIKGGWDGKPHHDAVKEALGLGHKLKTSFTAEAAGTTHPTVDFHISDNGEFFFHETGPGRIHPHDPKKVAKIVEKAHPDLKWGKVPAEDIEADPSDPRLG